MRPRTPREFCYALVAVACLAAALLVHAVWRYRQESAGGQLPRPVDATADLLTPRSVATPPQADSAGNDPMELLRQFCRLLPGGPQSAAESPWLKGKVAVDETHSRGPVVAVVLSYTKVADRDLAPLCWFPQLHTLDLGNTRITDAGLAHLRGLSHLRTLFLNLTPVGDTGLRHLGGLTELQELNLFSTNVTDEGLVHLKGLARLESLTLTRTRVTEAGVRDLQKALPGLKVLR